MQDNELRERRAFRETFTRQKCRMEVVKTLPTLSKLAQKKAEKMQEDNKLKADLMALFAECKSSGSVISPVASPMTSPVHSADKTKFSRRHQRVAVYYHDLTKVLQDCKDMNMMDLRIQFILTRESYLQKMPVPDDFQLKIGRCAHRGTIMMINLYYCGLSHVIRKLTYSQTLSVLFVLS
jgi:hypothetical protein